jgi:serine/threonine-protein phosphatase PP1 catalytic subunit
MCAGDLDLDAIISTIGTRSTPRRFTSTEVEDLCTAIIPILSAEPTLLEVPGPINICGDIHGQLPDLFRCFRLGGLPPSGRWLFLGDYVDRGPQSVEVLCYLFALKIRYPNDIYLLRGNHESRRVSEFGGFASECAEKLDFWMWNTFCRVFDWMPLAAVVGDKYFCVHGGISPRLTSLQMIRDIRRPLDVPSSGLITDLLWSDPSRSICEFDSSERGNTVIWGEGPVRRFLARHGLAQIVRGHQIPTDGFEYPFWPSRTVVTVFGAATSEEPDGNAAAYLAVDGSGESDIVMVPSRGHHPRRPKLGRPHKHTGPLRLLLTAPGIRRTRRTGRRQLSFLRERS